MFTAALTLFPAVMKPSPAAHPACQRPGCGTITATTQCCGLHSMTWTCSCSHGLWQARSTCLLVHPSLADISLDVGHFQRHLHDNARCGNTLTASVLMFAVQRMNELSLAGCLRRFVRPERLGPAAHWRCSGCGSTAAALKQMSIRRLPLVLCFHMKRFEHGGAAGRAKKLDVPMKFPLNGLDMAPFTTSEALTAGHSNVTSRVAAGADRAAITGGGPSPGGADSSVAYEQPTATTLAGVSYQQQCLYELFGVVSHSGDMASGHYVSYVKCEGCWYLINDPWVVAVAEAHVAAAQAYMLFYAQEHLFGTGASSGLGTAAAAATGNTVMHIKQEPTVAHSGELATTAQTVVKPDPTAVAGVAAARLGNKLGATAGDQPLASADAEVLLEQQSSNKAMGLMADSPVAGW